MPPFQATHDNLVTEVSLQIPAGWTEMLGMGAGQTLRIILQFPSTAETKTCRAYEGPGF